MKRGFRQIWAAVLIAALCMTGLGIFSNQTVAEAAAGAEREAQSGISEIRIEAEFGQSGARAMFPLVNELRQGEDAWYWQEGDAAKEYCSDLSALSYDYQLEKVAMLRAAEIAVSYSHTRPNQERCFTAYQDYGCTAGAENIAAGYTTYQSVFEAWCETDKSYSGQGHRRNMLNNKVVSIGIGHVYFEGTHYWVQEFAYNHPGTQETEAQDEKVQVPVQLHGDLVDSLSLFPAAFELKVGEALDISDTKVQLEVSGFFNTYGTKSFTASAEIEWSVPEDGYVGLRDGKLEGKSAGTAFIQATVMGQVKSVPVTVDAPEPEATAKPTESPVMTQTPEPEMTANPTESPVVTQTPEPEVTAKPTESPVMTQTPEPEVTSKPTESPVVIQTPEPEMTANPTESPVMTQTPEPGKRPSVSGSVQPTAAPVAPMGQPVLVPTAQPVEEQIVTPRPNVGKVSRFRAKAARRKITVTWKKDARVSGYQIQISQKKTFRGAKTRTVGRNTGKSAFTRLKSKKKYYVRIRAYVSFRTGEGAVVKSYGQWTTKGLKVKV